MLRKLTVLLMAALFSVSVAGLSFAASHEKKPATPATPATPAKKEGAVNPCAAETSKKKKAKKKVAKKKAAKDEKGMTMAPEKPAPAKPAAEPAKK
ncbi:MAG: histone [candidate division NC10 bacterium]|nr:histone [candidate division NC10 bacterium]